jgi:uncharacterized protein YggE
MENKASVISVQGIGHIEVEANVLQINITVTETTNTIKQSQEEVNKIVNNIMGILKENNIGKKNIHTTSIDFSPEYRWENNSHIYVGQKVEQDVIVVIENLKNNLNKAIKILDSITVDNDSIRASLQFGIKENSEITIKCREMAYQDGFEKAKRYAELAGLKIGKAVRISESPMSTERYSSRDDGALFCEIGGEEAPSSSPTILTVGKISKSMSLYMDFVAE